MYKHRKIYILNLQKSKWGNSLALRIPSEIVCQLGLASNNADAYSDIE